MEKKFKMCKDHLEVNVTQEDKIFLPTENGRDEIGTYVQTTVQSIDLDGVKKLVDFVKGENEKASTQLNAINNQLEQIPVVEAIDPEVVDACKKRIDKGTKEFKQKMLILNNHLDAIQKRKQLNQQKEYIEKQLTQMEKELADLIKATK